MKMSVSYGSCYISVIGMEMTCPFCKVVVKSGESHECSPVEPKKLAAKPRKKSLLSGSQKPGTGE